MTLELKEPIPGVCNPSQIYSLSPLFGKGQVKAKYKLTEQEIEEKLNNDLQFLKDNPSYNDKGMMGIIINCKGELVQAKMDNKTQSSELDQQIEAIFNEFKKWQPGSLNGNPVDSSLLFSFTIKNGKLML